MIESVITILRRLNALTQLVHGLARKHAVGDIGDNVGGTGRLQRIGRVAQRSRAIGNVVDQMQNRSFTSPMMFITSDTPAFSRRLSTMASGASSIRFASPRARTTPPTSGETTVIGLSPCR